MAKAPNRPTPRTGGLTGRVRDSARSWIAAALVALIFAELVLFGGDRREVATAFTLAYALCLAALLTLSSWAPQALAAGRALWPLYLLFVALAAAIGLQFAPFPQGMARDAWAAAGGAPAITIDTFATLTELVKLLGLGAVFLLGAILGAGERRARAAYNAIGLLGAAYAAWALVGYYGGGLGGGIVKAGRLSGSMLSPNTAAGVLAVFATLGWTSGLIAVRAALGASDVAWERTVGVAARAWPWIGLTVLSLWAIALTGSRGGMLSALAGFITASAAVALARSRQAAGAETKQTIAAVAGGAMALAVLFVVAQGPFAARLGDYKDGVAGRTAYIDLYVSHLHDLPWTGLGLGTFSRFNPLMLGSSAPAWFWEFGAMHNVYLQWIYEGGLVGAALMFACIGWALAIIVPGAWRRGSTRPWPAAALGASAVMMTHAVIDFDIQIHAVAALWALILGAGAGAALRQERPR